jgi:hypothetical protein
MGHKQLLKLQRPALSIFDMQAVIVISKQDLRSIYPDINLLFH